MRTRNHTSWIAIAHGLVVVLAIGNANAEATPTPSAGQLPAVAADPHADARAALLSIYFHAYADPDALEQTELKPMSLREAARELRVAPCEPEDRLCDTRRRRAVAVMVGISTPPEQEGEPFQPVEVQKALLELEAPLQELTEELISFRNHMMLLGDEAELGFPPEATPEHCDLHEGCQSEQLAQPLKEEIAYLAMNKAKDSKWKPRCCACTEVWKIEPAQGAAKAMDPAANLTGEVYFRIRVERSYDEIKKTMDPQGWDECHGDFFSATYLADDDSCKSDATPTPLPTQPPGSAWSAALFEHFRITYPPKTSCSPNETRFQNVLRICARENNSKDLYSIDYGLCRSIDSSISCDPEPGGIVTDCGRVESTPLGVSGTRMYGTKHLAFSPRKIEHGLQYWLRPMLKALIDEAREEGVCCGMTSAVTCSGCAAATEDTAAFLTSPMCNGSDPCAKP
jgi:hypothetical protein